MSVLNYTVRARGKTVNLSQAPTQIKNILPVPPLCSINSVKQHSHGRQTMDKQRVIDVQGIRVPNR